MCDFSTASRKDFNIHIVKHHTTIEHVDGNITLNSTVGEEENPEISSEDKLETFDMKFNGCKKYATGEIPKYFLTMKFPDDPPRKVNHEHLGIGVFVKAHPFGHMGHMRTGV